MQLINSQTRLHQIIEALQVYIDRFGYERLETPLLQPADLFLTKAGDQFIQRLFTFERFGRQFALRPEFTASAAKAYADQMNGGGAPLPVRWQFDGAIFEDTPDATHLLQRYSVGAELIGWDSLSADAEVAAMTYSSLSAVGCASAVLVLGSVQFMRSLLEAYDLDARTLRFLMESLVHLNSDGKAYILERFDRLAAVTPSGEVSTNTDILSLPIFLNGETTLAGRTREDILRRIQRKSQRAASRSAVVEALDQLEKLHSVIGVPEYVFAHVRSLLLPHHTKALAALEALENLIPVLRGYGVPSEQIRIQPTLARDWNYYTGIVFELRTPSGEMLAGGGRYDELVRLVGGGDVPAVGMAIYIERLLPYADLPDTTLAVPVIIDTSQSAEIAAWWAAKLRSEGVTVSLLDFETHELPKVALAFIALSDGTVRHGNETFAPDQFDDVLSSIKTGMNT